MVRDIAIFEPTHIARESGLPSSGCRPPAEGVQQNMHPLQADVGSAKGRRGHPPGINRVKPLLYTAMRVLFGFLTKERRFMLLLLIALG